MNEKEVCGLRALKSVFESQLQEIGGVVLTADNSKNEAFYKMRAGDVLEKPESVSLTNVSVDLRGFSDIVKMYAK